MLLFFWQNISKVYFSLGCLLFFVSFLPGHFSKIKEYSYFCMKIWRKQLASAFNFLKIPQKTFT